MAMLEAIVFDFDGVLVDSEPLHYRAFVEVLRPHGIEFDYGRYTRSYIGFDDRDAFRAIRADHGLPADDAAVAGWIAQKARAFEQLARSEARAFPGVVELIRETAARLPVAICSGALRSDIDAVLDGLDGGDLATLFATIVTADDVTHSKPDPQSYALAAERIGVDPARALAIEDTPAGLASARGAGLRRLAVTNTHHPDALRDAEHVVDSLAGLTLQRLRTLFGRPAAHSGET